MSLSYTERRNLAGGLGNNTETSTLSLFDTLMNMAEKKIFNRRPWPFRKTQYTVSTDSSNQFVSLPMYTDRAESVYVTIDSTRYSVRECPSREDWDILNETVQISDIPEFYLIFDGKIGLYPRPATSGNTVTINAQKLAKDLTVADYTTGTISAVTNGATTVTGSGTSWTSQMAGRWLRITDGNEAGKGDGHWYQIASVASTTSLTLVRAYAGTTISGGAATYTISQMSALPEAFHDLPVWKALQLYFTSVDPEPAQADRYGLMYKEDYADLVASYGSETQNVVIDEGYEHEQTY